MRRCPEIQDGVIRQLEEGERGRGLEREAGGTNLVKKKGGGEYDSERRAFVSLSVWRAATPEPAPAVERSNLLRALLLCRAAEGLVEPTRH